LNDWAIRPARVSDAPAIAALAAQLGYPSPQAEIEVRMEGLDARGRSAILVAEAGTVVAWIAVRGDLALESGPYAEIAGLVVDEAWRGRGAGEALVAAAEAWARKQGHTRVRVRSNVLRERAHQFYERLGYVVTKKQVVFDKLLR
jgi:GNAT superfamily N-acetyltransferase